MASLVLWLEMEGKHVVTGVGVWVVARTDGLHLIRQPRVLANDVANLVLRVRIVIRIGNSTWQIVKQWFIISFAFM